MRTGGASTTSSSGGRDPAQHGSDPLDELLVVERTRDVVVAAASKRVDPIDRVRLLAPEHDHRRTLDPAVEPLDVAREHEIEPPVVGHELEAVPRKVPLEEPARLGLGVGEEQVQRP